jgi:hypothetical protein
MPYIKQSQRKRLEYPLDVIVNQLNSLEQEVACRPGLVNYAITSIVLRTLKPDDGWSYTSISRAVAVLRDAATEMERRLMAKREDQAILNNGDIPEYQDQQ